jgi:uncharacterized protein (DUF1810 family)
MNIADKFDLKRFVDAQNGVYERVLAELRAGQKTSHWMWFIFPQMDGLAMSATSRHYAIKSLDEARGYLEHPILGHRLIECSQTLLDLEDRSASQIFGYPDDLKLRSSMTLFSLVENPDPVFASVLDKYFGGKRDKRTLHILKQSDI